MSEWHQISSRIKRIGTHPRRVASVALWLAIAVLAVGLLAGCGSETAQGPSEEIQGLLQDRFEAMNTGNAQAIAQYYATNAVLDNYADGTNVQGATAIANYFNAIVRDLRMQWKAADEPIQYDKFVLQRVSMSQVDGPGTGAAFHILDIDANNQIAHEWIIGWARE